MKSLISTLGVLHFTLLLSTGFLRAQVVFPADSGVIDLVTDYGIDNTGTTDVTALLQQAVSENAGAYRTLFLRAGIYKVSNTIDWVNLQGEKRGRTALRGAGEELTIIRLIDNAPGFATSVKPVLRSNDKDWATAFGNYFRDLTVEVGAGNAKAVGIDFLANNYGGVENVTIRSLDPNFAGFVGLDMRQPLPGPAFVKNVTIVGFEYGLYMYRTRYSVTFEHLTLTDQTRTGARVDANSANFRDLQVIGNGWGIEARSGGTINLIDSSITRRSGSGGQAMLMVAETQCWARNLQIDPAFGSHLRRQQTDGTWANTSTVPSSGEWTATARKQLFPDTQQQTLNLPVEETPVFFDQDLTHWFNVADYGANPNDQLDDHAAIQAAIDAAASAPFPATVYFPVATLREDGYLTSESIRVHGNVKKLEGLLSEISPLFEIGTTKTAFGQSESGLPIVVVQSSSVGDVFIENFRIDALVADRGRPLKGIEHAALGQRLIISHVAGNLLTNTAGAGDIFLEDVVLRVATKHPTRLWARQLNSEGIEGTKNFNNGGDLWILGLKTEMVGTNILTVGNGRTELLGGMLMPIFETPTDLPMLVSEDSAVSYVARHQGETSVDRRFNILVSETRGGVSESMLQSESGGGKENWLSPYYGQPTNFVPNTGTRAYLTADLTRMIEGGASINVDVNRTGSTAAALTVNLQYSGMATDVDVSSRPATIVIPAGSAKASVTISALADGLSEDRESLIMSVAAGAYQVGWPEQLSLSVFDVDSGAPVFGGNTPVLSLRADGWASIAAGEGRSYRWEDQSGNGFLYRTDDYSPNYQAPLLQEGGLNGRDTLVFDGDYLNTRPQVGDPLAGIVLKQRTFLAVLETGADVTGRQLIFDQGSEPRGFNLYIAGGRLYGYVWEQGNGGQFETVLSAAIQPNTFYAVEFGYDSINRHAELFLNGISVDSVDGTNIKTMTVTYGDRSGIGALIGGTRFHDIGGVNSTPNTGRALHFFGGKVAELHALNAVLNATGRTDLRTG